MSRAAATALALMLMVATGRAQVPEWSPEPLVRIGSVDHPDQALSRVSGILIDAEQRIYILQPQSQHIAVFSTGGDRLLTIGRSGHGPGEFDALSGAGFRRDTLYATDNGLRRITFFDPAGTVLSTTELTSPPLGEPPQLYIPTVPQIVRADGSALVRPAVPVVLMASGSDSLPYLHIDDRGQILDTLAWEALPHQTFEIPSSGRRIFAPMPFRDTPIYHLLPDGSGLVIVHRPFPDNERSGEYHVTRINVDGDTVFSVRREYVPTPIDRAEVARAVAVIADRFAGRPDAPTPAVIERSIRAADLVPRYRTPVSAVASGLDGSVWLKHNSNGPMAIWLVLDQSGADVARLTLPANQTVEFIRRDLIVTLELDSLDVPYVTAYRIRR